MRVMVTGADGFVGQHTVSALLARGHDVYAVGGPKSDFPVSVDLVNNEEVKQAVGKIRPEVILHLAAQSSVHRSWDSPETTVLVNTVGTLNLWQAATDVKARRFVYVSSAEVYGPSHSVKRLSEEDMVEPANPYGVSKASSERLLLQLSQSGFMKLIILRPFNHVGPGQHEGFVVMNFARQIKEIQRGGTPILHVGNLLAVRDFLDVRDVAIAYTVAVENQNLVGVYNVCSGVPRSIGSVLKDFIRISNTRAIKIEEDTSRLRPTDVPSLVGDPSRYVSITGWSPVRRWEDTLNDILNEIG